MPKDEVEKKSLVRLRKILSKGYYAKTRLLLALNKVFVDPKIDRTPQYIKLSRKSADGVCEVVSAKEGFWVYEDKIVGIDAAIGRLVTVKGEEPEAVWSSRWAVYMADAEGNAPAQPRYRDPHVSEMGKEQVMEWGAFFKALQTAETGYYSRLSDKLKEKKVSYKDLFKFDVMESYKH